MFILSFMSLSFKQKSDFFLTKYVIPLILVDFHLNLSRFFMLSGSGSTFPEVDPDPANEVDRPTKIGG